MLLYKESRKCFECLETSIRPIKEEKSKYIVNKLDDAKLELQIKKQNNLNKLPQCVDFLFFVENIKINNDGYIESNKARKLISVKNYICWVIKSKHAIAISEYLKTKAHKVVYYKENINSSIFNEQVSNNNAIRTNIKITNGESSLFKEIAKYSNKNLITKEKKNDKATIEKVQISDTRNSLPIIKRQTLPSNISICIFTNSINILDGIYIQQKEIHKELLFSSNVCWIANKEKSIVIAKYIGYFSAIESYLYKIQYCIENVNEDVYINDEQDYIYSEDFDVFAEWEIIRKLKCIVNTHNGYLTNNTENTYNNTMIGHHFELSKSTLEATFTIDDVAYTMKKNDVWINADIFSRRQFVQKKNLIAILLDSNSKILVENNKTFYEIIGEGKDNRFNQDFGPVNKAIRDNEKQIILFYKDKNGKLRFADEVICEGFRFENDGKKTIRKIIVFKLRPLNDTDLRKEENKTSEEEISNESILIEKIDSFDDEKQACLTQTISKDFSETDDSYTNNTKNEDKMKEEDIDVHAHLNKLYQTMSNLKELGLKINDDIINETNRLEEKIIKEKLLPTITSKITDVLSSIERDLTLIVNYTPKQPISFSISREHFANTEINTKFLEIANKEDNEENTEHVLHKKSAKSNLRITLPNGRIITHSTAVESLIEFISYVGAEKAQKVGLIRCKIPLISQYIDEKYRDRQKSIGKGLYLMTCTSTEAKKEDIEKIAGFYNMKINVEII